jgi:hypothetical protein
LEFRTDSEHIYTHLDYPLNEGGALMIGDLEEPERKPIRLALAQLKLGLERMAKDYPTHWADFINENDDSSTADVFLQLCLFGEVIYG